MSRSYKKHNIWKCAGDTSFKKIYNRKLRRSQLDNELLPKGNGYRKMNCPWCIADYRFRADWEEYKKWGWVQRFETEEEAWAEWKRLYGSK